MTKPTANLFHIFKGALKINLSIHNFLYHKISMNLVEKRNRGLWEVLCGIFNFMTNVVTSVPEKIISNINTMTSKKADI